MGAAIDMWYLENNYECSLSNSFAFLLNSILIIINGPAYVITPSNDADVLPGAIRTSDSLAYNI